MRRIPAGMSVSDGVPMSSVQSVAEPLVVEVERDAHVDNDFWLRSTVGTEGHRWYSAVFKDVKPVVVVEDQERVAALADDRDLGTGPPG